MNRLGCLLLLIACTSCDALSFESSLFSPFVEPNPKNCVVNPNLCVAPEVCDTTLQVCHKNDGTCMNTAQCTEDKAPVCNNNACVPCNATTQATGDMQCGEWATGRMNQNRVCINGACKECRNNGDCTKLGVASKTYCNPDSNLCEGCKRDEQCPSMGGIPLFCKTDDSILSASDSPSNIGECVAESSVAFVENRSGCSDSATDAGTTTKPFCQIQAAIDKKFTYIRVLGGTGYTAISVAASGQRAVVKGPSKDQSILAGASVTNGARLTLLDMGITYTGTGVAVSCNGSGNLTMRRSVLTLSAGKGVYATSCGRAIIEQSKVNGVGSSGYAISLSVGTGHVITNTAVINNNGSVAEPDAVKIGAGTSGLFAFNTIVNNRGLGVSCDGQTEIRDSIVMSNGGTQLSANCQQTRLATMAMGLILGAVAGMPADPTVTADPNNQVTDKGMPAPGVTVDYFGMPRTLGAAPDYGFQEFK